MMYPRTSKKLLPRNVNFWGTKSIGTSRGYLTSASGGSVIEGSAFGGTFKASRLELVSFFSL